ncbi:PAS domain-containing protein [Oscillochloris sp. ZM17-4]|uniref:PAS domain-containing protein n=1 Tax=Oscillochloris sp. ZM17-4 TaxID=2866714 RepID=UPI001C730518|nr:PAS domain-containing protein [Oscillochloris sp. ZM17-4]MBX0326457.1 PAS domain-containing protein [Oscillochloris sp. ZM17-4]
MDAQPPPGPSPPPPQRSLAIASSVDATRWLIMIIVGVLDSLLSEGLHRARRSAEASRQLYAVTLASIGDAVIATDAQGSVTFINAEAALRRSERTLKLFVEMAPAAIAMFDREMRYLVVSRRFISDYRIGDQDLIGRSHDEIFPEIPDRWREIQRRCMAGSIETCAVSALCADRPWPEPPI